MMRAEGTGSSAMTTNSGYKRTVLLVTFMLLFSALGGTALLLAYSDSSSAGSGNWNSGDYTIDTQVNISSITSKSNITIINGGNLSITDGTLRMQSNDIEDRYLSITVGHGGTLYLNNATIAASMNEISGGMPLLSLLVENGGRLIMENGSVLKFPGHIVIDNAEMKMYNSTIRGMAGSDAYDLTGDIAFYCDPARFPAANFSHSAVLTVISSDFLMVNSSILDVFEGGALDPGTAVSDYPFVSDGEDRSTVNYDLNRYPSSLVNLSQPVNLLYADDDERYTIAAGENLTVEGFDMGGLLFNAGEATVSLHVIYRTGADFINSADLMVGRDGVSVDEGDLTNSITMLGNVEKRINVALDDYASWEYADLSVSIDNALVNVGAIEIDRLWLNVELEVDVFRNITLMGDTRFTAIDSLLDIDQSQSTSDHNALTVKDSAQAFLYGVEWEPASAQPFAHAINLEPAVITLLPLAQAGGNTTGSTDTTPLFFEYAVDAAYYNVSSGETVEILINTTGLNGYVTSVVLNTIIRSASSIINPIQWGIDGSVYNTSIVPTSAVLPYSFTLPLTSIDDIEKTVFIYDNSAGDGTVNIDYLALEVTTAPQVHIYKWAEVTVWNGELVLPGLGLQAFQQGTSNAAQYADTAWSNSPPQYVIDHLGRGADYNVTDSQGMATIPLLVDSLNISSSSSFSYNLVSTALAQSGSMAGQSAVQFKEYPYLYPGVNDDTTKSVTITMTGAKSDLTVSSFEVRDYLGSVVAPPISVNRTDVLNFTFNVSNYGPVPATNFLVNLSDGENLLQSYLVPYIGIWADPDTRNVTLYYDWTATYPLDIHNLTVTVDPLGVVNESNESNNQYVSAIEVLPAPELLMGLPQLLVNATGSYLYVTLQNTGDTPTGAFEVDFHINGTYNDTVSITDLAVSATEIVYLPFNQSAAGYLVVQTVINSTNHLLDEINTTNNLTINLVVSGLGTTSNNYAVKTTPSMSVVIANGGVYDASNVNVRIELYQDGVLFDTELRNIGTVTAGGSLAVPKSWSSITPTAGTQWVNFEIRVTVNPDSDIPESNYGDNYQTHNFTVNDNRVDLTISYLSTSVDDAGPQGQRIDVMFQVDNIGSSLAATPVLTFYLIDTNGSTQVINVTLTSIAPNGNLNSTVSWTIAGAPGAYDLEARINEFNTIDERNISNNELSMTFEITPLEPGLNLNTNRVNYKVGEAMVILGSVYNANNVTQRLASTVVVVTITNGQGQTINTYTLTTDSNGGFRQDVPVTEVMSGAGTTITATVAYGTESASSAVTVYITSSITDDGQPWWMWVLIIVVMLLIIVIFSFYIYRYSLGKMVECGECHSLIPEASHSCPNCGVDFEVGTAKCSECGAWIPANSKKCPECNASFIGSVVTNEEESDYIQLMREGYGAYVDAFRPTAQEELGKKYSDQRFLRWWTDHPEHITFEEWLSKEEGERKEQTFKCPSCGSINAKGSKQCIRCNRSFVRAKETPVDQEAEMKAEEPVVAPVRRVVRKRKVGETTPETSTETPVESEEKASEAPAMKKRAIVSKKDSPGKTEGDEDAEGDPEEGQKE